MLRRLSSRSSLIGLGLILIAIAFIALFFLPWQVELSLNLFISYLVDRRSRVMIDSPEIVTFRRVIADRFLLQSAYVFLTGIVLLAAGLFKQTNR
ncbi:hypothetical protein H6G20_18210 [Desertifilum sp. FACHB-1129]|uniref:Uncharacterized protein n=2 Tax=Desertifilum tharense IPPAS B-1220 TaxID=1781255 RepID=A0A1E5QIP8_9CYAN|nr:MULTISPECIES: hypothetical protein [Desertifilum]MDA0210168.1 hypothetical protein [Cyanobacteria bacterium FC1]MBD2313606.1 hypothetical protein [Desertifilum sp. FACHB-1129]MBD2320573.1 hypothetical protein [Desertifilum sp. FACHB-866]MBD2330701.1 hypothetical protein [Desertifilum sp. FACHB-868]OEJ74498.1 hypothetical protein BH720_14855 [Desertifilum tharense IPPAS B-1220]